MIRLLIARHGQSVWNAVGRWQGRADPPLSELGIAQARAAGGAAGAFDAVVTSPLERALLTGSIIAEAIGVGPMLVNEGIQERHAGDFQGLTRIEIEEKFPGYLDNGKRPPGWEPDEEVTERVLTAIDDISAHIGADNGADSDVLVITHAGVIYALESHFGQDFLRIDNLNGRWFLHQSDRWSMGERISLLPDSAIATEADSL